MKFEFNELGLLPAGIHDGTINDIETEFSFSPKRKEIITGLKQMLAALKDIGCEYFYLDGSFVTNKLLPGDFDACWDLNDKIDWDKLKISYPELIIFKHPRDEQKAKYLGEAFISSYDADGKGTTFVDFFQKTKEHTPKGIIRIRL